MIRIGIVGTGVMGGGHARSFNAIKGCRVTACCDIVPGRARAFADEHDIPGAYTDAEEMLRKEALDGVSVVTVDKAHAPAALPVIKHGLPVMCEKPLADTLRNARRMATAAKKAGVLTTVNFSYRDPAATQKAAAIVAEGRLGNLRHVEGSFLQSWLVGKHWGDWREKDSLLWRLSTAHGSAGALGDLGVHLYDFASFIAGDISAIQCRLETFGKGKKKLGPYVFDANDSMAATVRFKSGALGLLHATRWATGHANSLSLRVYGDRGGLDIDLTRPAEDMLRVCVDKDVDTNTWRSVKCPPVPNMYRRFVDAIKTGKQSQTSFAVGARVQAYLDASAKSAEADGAVVNVPGGSSK